MFPPMLGVWGHACPPTPPPPRETLKWCNVVRFRAQLAEI